MRRAVDIRQSEKKEVKTEHPKKGKTEGERTVLTTKKWHSYSKSLRHANGCENADKEREAGEATELSRTALSSPRTEITTTRGKIARPCRKECVTVSSSLNDWPCQVAVTHCDLVQRGEILSRYIVDDNDRN